MSIRITRKNSSIALILIVLLVILLYPVRRYITRTTGQVTVLNKSSEVIALAEVEVCEQVMQFKMIEINASKESEFRITGDAHYIVLVELFSGKKLTKEIGYVTKGIETQDTLIITDDDISLDRKVKRDEEN